MNSVVTVGLLAFLIGLALGTLGVLYFDTRYWKKREQTAAGERNKTQAVIQITQSRLQRAEKGQLIAGKDVESLRQDVAERDDRLQEQRSELQDARQKLETAQAEIEQLESNLRRTTEQANDLQEEVQSLRNDVLGVQAEKKLLQENSLRLENQLEAVRAESQQISQRLAVADVEMKHLQADLAEAQGWEEKAAALKTENEALVGQLNRAEIHLGELQVQVDAAAHQLVEKQMLGKKLVEVQNKLKETEKHSETLQEKMTAVQHTLDYTGKNQLQLIRGIGPAYARRLNEAGILTLKDLAKCTPEQVAEIVQTKKWQRVETESWIREAKALTVKVGDDSET